MATRREATRAATIEEIKQTARDLMREKRSIDVTFADIAREMGMTAPALYRYFAGRDELLTALITDAYDEVGARLAAARESVQDGDTGRRMIAVAQAYRAWAVEFPERFELLFGLPLAGYEAPADGPTTEAAARAMANFHALVAEAQDNGELRPPLVTGATQTVCAMLDKEGLTDVPADNAASLLNAWAVLQGFVALEAFGNLAWIGQDAADDLFVNHLRVLAEVTGIPAPLDGWTLEPPGRSRRKLAANG